MKQHIILFFAAMISFATQGQGRGVRIGYIDMEYILEKVPDYAEAKNQLELKAQGWKQEAEVKKNEINKLKENLKTERVLLTKELIEEREEEIAFLESELLNFQQKRFGPTGDLMTQKAVLVKPIQDQVFTIVQDIAKDRYDFVFDKSSDLTMLFAAQQHNISDRVVRQLSRSANREKMSTKQIKEQEEADKKQDEIDDNPALAERQKALEAKQAERQKMLEDRQAAAEAKRQAFEEKRQKLIDERNAKREAAKNKAANKTSESTSEPKEVDEEKPAGEAKTEDAQPAKKSAEEIRQEAAAERQRKLDERKAAIEERRRKLLEEREAAKQARENKTTTPPATPTDEN